MKKNMIISNYFILIRLFFVFILLCSTHNIFSQTLYPIEIPFSFNSFLLKHENTESLIGDTVLIDLKDFTEISEVYFNNTPYELSANELSKKVFRIDSVTIVHSTMKSKKRADQIHCRLTLSSLTSELRFKLSIKISSKYISQPENIVFIRKSVYDKFISRLMNMSFDTDLDISNEVPDSAALQYESDNHISMLKTRIDTNIIKQYNLDSLSKGWKVKKVFVYGSDNLFAKMDSIDYDNYSYYRSAKYGPGLICLVTENYLQHYQFITLYLNESIQEEYFRNDLKKVKYVSDVPTIDVAKKLMKKYGRVNWLKSRFIHYNPASILYDSAGNESQVNSYESYLEPVISGNKILYFQNVSLIAFSIYYDDHNKLSKSLKQIYKSQPYLLHAYMDSAHKYDMPDEYTIPLSELIHTIRKNPDFENIHKNSMVTILQFHITFGSSLTEFAFINGKYFSDF